MGCKDCGFVPEPFKEWGFLSDSNPRWSCAHSGGNCRYCDSCSAWWHRTDMEKETDEGRIKREECPECTAINEAFNETALEVTK